MRSIILLMIVVLLVADVGYLLAGSVQYVYSKDKFDWTETTFSNYRVVRRLVAIHFDGINVGSSSDPTKVA